MSRPKLNLNSYRILLMQARHTGKMRLLVEGEDDLHLFKLLVDEISQSTNKPQILKNKISIDVVDNIVRSEELIEASEELSSLGAREKIERICKHAKGEEYASQLIGFVDREFRGFDIARNCSDGIKGHFVDDRLIWSKGHSIENYFFDKIIVRRLTKQVVANDWFEEVLDLIDETFASAILLACAVSLATKEASSRFREKDFTRKVDRSLEYEVMKICSSDLEFNYDLWTERLKKRQNISLEAVEFLENRTIYWINKLKSIDINDQRWLCRGHTGLKTLWALLELCIFEADPDSKNPKSHVGNFKDRKKFNSYANIWIQQVMTNDCNHPVDTLKQLGLPL